MKIAVSATGTDLSAQVDPRFGRAAFFVVYDTDADQFDILNNSENAEAAQGAGIQAAQLVSQQSVEVVVSGSFGPKAFEALDAAGIQMVAWSGGTIAEAIDIIRGGEFQSLESANVRGHWR